MKIKDLFAESYGALSVNKVRSGLTILGIVIGIGSVIALVSIGQAAQTSIQQNIQSIGSNLIFVTPGATRTPGAIVSTGRGAATSLTLADEQAIATGVTGATAVAPELQRSFQIVAKGTNTNTRVLGTSPSYAQIRNINMELGSFITDTNVTDGARVAVLGPTTRDDLFGAGADPTGQMIRISGDEFTVIGVMQAKGGNAATNSDDMVVVPISTAQHYLSAPSVITGIDIEASSPDMMSSVQQQVTDLLDSRHHISDPALADFTVVNQADLVATASSVTGTFTALLSSIAGISLIVGGIGIMNMMLTTVTERTREIGLRKAIGATRSDVNFQFLVEAVMLTFLGGFFGIVLGWLVSLAVSRFGGIASQISVSSILLAFGVSAAIGLVFGYYPARRASKLNPIEALRFE